MAEISVIGHPRLQGELRVQGSKNAAQKILPATVVFPGEYALHNVPNIQDSKHLVEILEFLGATVSTSHDGHELYIDTRTIVQGEILPEITAKSTGSFLFAGALLSRFGEVKIWHPGGDQIGSRHVTWHLNAFRQLGAAVYEEQDFYVVSASELKGCTIAFDRFTVNGTVNAILASVRAAGTTILKNVPLDIEIDNFVAFMNAGGSLVKRVGNGHEIHVVGKDTGASYTDFTVIPDRNDAATFLIASALCESAVDLVSVQTDELLPLIKELETCGVVLEVLEDLPYPRLRVKSDRLNGTGLHITSAPVPGFPTDWGPMVQVLMTQLPAISTFHETVFSQRFSHLRYLEAMGARIKYFNPDVDDAIYNFVRTPNDNTFHAVRITGPTRLVGRNVEADNVRAGAALVLAGLVADGVTSVGNAYQIDRGYEAFSERLSGLGASVTRIE